ncbi:MAG: amidohydrolase family protein [Candidatus Bipolaricaulota bacterium]
MGDLRVYGGTVVTPRTARRADLLIRNGRIVKVGDVAGCGREQSARGLLVLPGAVDAHVHFSLPVAGTRSADDFERGTLAAAGGGVTTVVDFTLGAPDVSLAESIEQRIAQASGAAVDFALRAEMIGWTNDRREELRQAASLGVRSFKFYLSYAESGRRTPLGVLREAMQDIRALGGVAMVHAEAQELTVPEGGPTPRARPAVAEAVAVAAVGELARDTGCRAYVAHISSEAGLAGLQAAQARGAPVVGETCPQYLFLTEECYCREDGHLFSVVPPLRADRDLQALWRGLSHNAFQAVATDHCPFTRKQKSRGWSYPATLSSGLPGLELLPAILLSEGWARGPLSLRQVAWYMGEGPARAFGLWPVKGAIIPGADADLVLWDPKARRTVRAAELRSAAGFSPYEGMELAGRPVGVLSRGEWLLREGELLARPGRGRFVPWKGELSGAAF